MGMALIHAAHLFDRTRISHPVTNFTADVLFDSLHVGVPHVPQGNSFTPYMGMALIHAAHLYVRE